jgi:hypothetical protein
MRRHKAMAKEITREEKIALVQEQKSSILLATFEQIARRNEIFNDDLKILREELLRRLAKSEEADNENSN